MPVITSGSALGGNCKGVGGGSGEGGAQQGYVPGGLPDSRCYGGTLSINDISEFVSAEGREPGFPTAAHLVTG